MRVLLHGRDEKRTRDAAARISAQSGRPVLPVLADFESLDAVRDLARTVDSLVTRLDALVNNAGTFQPARRVTRDGNEVTFQVNHLAPFLLTMLLHRTLVRSTPARVVTVSSNAHFRATLDFDDLGGERAYDGYAAYALSKLANVMFAYDLAERLAPDGVTSNAVHPGTADTNMLRLGFPGARGTDVAEAALGPVWLATSPEAANLTGRYFDHTREARSSELSYDRAARVRLWRVSEQLTGIVGAVL